MIRVFVARHGETEWNREGRWQGQGGPGLNETGRIQARALAMRLSALHVDALYSSDLARARETAEIVATATGLEPVFDPGLREVDVGDWRGLTRDQVSRRDPAGYRRWLGGEAGWNGGETYAEMHARVVATVERLVAASAVGRIAVISHGGAVRALAANAVGLPKHERLRIEGARNCSLTTLSYDHGDARLVGYNDDGHLPPAPI
ncbi:MAG: glucosyl-3-phosphoglycerate phosphatase [Gaiellales bacterium]|jgi:broad specificity phosphatase PhoE|nr:glucosyl-3-phosphoglycerate phosphatase [Gaiellales bacterium]